MKDLVLELNQNPAAPEPQTKTTPYSDDILGRMLQGTWETWSTIRSLVEEEWLIDLRAVNQKNEADVEQLSKFHSHIYMGLTRTKCMSAYGRITDLMFQSEKHWSIAPTPVPESEMKTEGIQDFIDDMKARAEAMELEIADRLLDMHYEDHLKAAILEACTIGTGCVKGVLPGVKKIEKWGFVPNAETGVPEWDVIKSEVPAPKMSSPTIFDVYPDPYATCVEDMSGVFERHVLNRKQFSELRDDSRFNAGKINEILAQTDNGTHVDIYHENERRNLANVQNASATSAPRYDVLEYWGQVTGRNLQAAGVGSVEETETYWANVWTCSGKTLLAKVAPMKKQRIPYHFFFYSKVSQQFWGVAPSRMMRASQAGLNGSVWALLDSSVLAAYPMCEVNVTMLQDGQDPRVMLPGQVWLRDSGDPSVRAVNFFQPNAPTGQLMQMAEMFKNFADDETALPAYTYGDKSSANQTSSGLSMQLGVAAIPIKAVVKNLEDFCVEPVITSVFDWVMEWADEDSGRKIKGDMQIQVLGTSALLAKEVKSQALMQFLNITQNPIDSQYVDRKYLIAQVAKSLEIDIAKALPNKMPEQPPQEPPKETMLDQAKAQLVSAQTKKEGAMFDKVIAETAGINIKAQYEAMQTAGQVLLNPGVVPVGDELMLSAGYKDHNGAPLANVPQDTGQPFVDNVPENTSPQFPPTVPQPEESRPTPPNNLPNEMKMASPGAGLETAGNETLQNM